nr:sodium:solute symporter family protein [Armatimonas sp.]
MELLVGPVISLHFALADYCVLVLYALALVFVGLRQRKVVSSEASAFLVAGRGLTLPAFVATLVATWYGGILGVGELAYGSGLGAWTVFGLPYYVFALIYALWLAPKVRTAARFTIPDTLEAAHGKPVALLGAVLVFFLVAPAPYALMTGTLLQAIFGGPLWLCVTLGTLLSVVFVVRGGLETDVRTNLVQFLLMFLGFGLLVAFCFAKVGGLPTLAAQLPATHKSLSGGNPLPYILVWYCIALWTLADPGFHQRCSAAESPKVAQRGILVSIVCWALFDFLTVSAGCYARVLLPHLEKPIDAYPALAEALLPPLAKGIFWVGMLATVMSTLISYAFLAATTIGRDLAWRAWKADQVLWTRVGVGIAALLAIAAALALPSVVGLWLAIGSAFVPGLLVPLLTAYAPTKWRARPAFTLAGMVLGTGLPLLWMVIGQSKGAMDAAHYPFGIEAIYVGLGASLLCWALGLKKLRQQNCLDDYQVKS